MAPAHQPAFGPLSLAERQEMAKKVRKSLMIDKFRVYPWQGESPGSCHPFFSRPGSQQLRLFPDQPEEAVEIAVIGAGLAGLTAAYHLRERRLAVLEAGDRPGGVCLAGSAEGITFPAGSAYCYYPWNDTWRQWYAQLGLEMAAALVAPPASALWLDGTWLPDCFTAAAISAWPVSLADKEKLRLLIEDLARWEETWDVLGTRQLPAPDLDQVTLAHYLEQIRGLSRQVTVLLDPYCRSCLGAGPDVISAWAGLYFLMSEFSPTSRLVAFPEGNARLTAALERTLPQPVRCQQTVVAVRPRREGGDLLIWDGQARTFRCLAAEVIIMAGGKHVAARLLGDSWGWSQQDWQRFRYSSYVVAACLGPLPLTAPGYENWVPGEPAFADFLLTPRDAEPGAEKALILYAPQAYPAGRTTLLQQPEETQANILLAALARHFPGTLAAVRAVHLYRFGHAQILATPGFNTWVRREFCPARRPIILANSDQEGFPCVEAAIIQGQQAAQTALAYLKGEKR